jgi:gliding motility-associated-like protein
VTPNNTITLSSVAGTDSQTVCINTAITSVTYTTTGATDATFAGLPAGVSGAWLNNVVTISGTPTVSGTYNYIITLTGGCGIITKNGIIVVSQQSVAGNVAITTGSSTICSNSPKPIITLSGNTGLTIKWQSSLDGTNFSDISPAQTGTNINTAINNIASGNTQVVTYYLASVQSGACPAVSTSPVSITVDPIPQLTAIVSNEKTQQVCIGISANDVNLTTNVGTIVWKYSSTSGSGYLPFSPNQTNSRLSNSVINTNNAGTTYYKAFVTSGVCAAVQSEEIVVRVDAATVAGTIASNSNLICNGSTPPTISLTGNTGSIIQWQTRLASATYVDPIPSQTGISISSVVNNSAPSSSQVVNYYQAIVKSGVCNPLTTNEVAVAVDPTSKVGLIEPLQKNQEICIGSSATSIVLPSHTGTIQWQTANLGGSYTDMAGLINASLLFGNIPTNVAGTKIYRAQVTSGVCPAIYSEIATVRVDAATVAGTIASNSNLICNGSTPPTISLTGNTGSTIQWRTRLASTTYVNPIPSQNGTSISSVVNNSAPASSQVVNYYQAIVKSGVCNPLTTNEVTVAIDPTSQVGLLEPAQKSQEVCIGSPAKSVVLPSYTGTIQWQNASLGSAYGNMSGVTSATLPFVNIPTNTAGTINYRAAVTSGVCPVIYSEIASVQTDAATEAGDIFYLNGNSPICNLGSKPTISIKNNIGTNIVWQTTTVTNSTSVIGTANSLNYTNTYNTGNLLNSAIDNTAPGVISSFKYYRASVRNGVCKTEYTAPIELEVIPTPLVTKVVPAERCGPGVVDLLAESNLGTPNWFEASTGGTAISTANNYTTPFLNRSTNYYAGAIFRGCVSFNRTTVLAKIKPIPSITSVINATNCGPGNLELSATASGGIINWFSDPNAGATLLTASKYMTPLISNTTTYYAEALLDGCISAPRTPVLATIFEVPIVNPLPDLFNLCAGLRLSVNTYAALGSPPYNYIFYTNNGNVVGQKDGYLLGVKGGITNVYFNVKDINGCISQNTNSFKVQTYDPVLPQNFNFQAFYKDNLLIPTKLDSGYILYNWQPQLNLNFYDKPNPIFNGENTIDYTLIRTDTTSRCIVADNYHIDVTRDFIFDLPNAFTPNYDGINDIISVIANAGIEKINYLRIYNRTGNLVFQTANIKEGWNGKVAEKTQESDAYYWKAEYVTKLNQVLKKAGSFLLLK